MTCLLFKHILLNLLNSVALVRERAILTERTPLVGEVNAFADRGCRVVSTTNPYCRILGFLDWLNLLIKVVFLFHIYIPTDLLLYYCCILSLKTL
jgi:hypothetical protein